MANKLDASISGFADVDDVCTKFLSVTDETSFDDKIGVETHVQKESKAKYYNIIFRTSKMVRIVINYNVSDIIK